MMISLLCRKPKIMILFMMQLACLSWCVNSEEATSPPATTPNGPKPRCSIFKDVGANYLSINDIVVKSPTSNTACIKARFSLAIKVEAAIENTIVANNSLSENSTDGDTANKRIFLGYLPLDSVMSVEDTCPDATTESPDDLQKERNRVGGEATTKLLKLEELEMIVNFECGKLVFEFKRTDNFFLSAIRGVVNLDSNTMREFIAEQPMFLTSDLAHHFKSSELIEVNSTAKTKGFILTADFYYSEFEPFRNTTSRDFIWPPDKDSKPFLVTNS